MHIVEHKFKALILTLVLCFFSFFVRSQIIYTNKETASFGFTVGLTSSNLYNDTIAFKSGTLFLGGFAYSLTLTERTKLGVDLFLSGKAFKKDDPIVKFRYGYVDLPVYLQYHFTDDIKLNIGAQYSKYVFSQRASIDGSKKTGVRTEKINSDIDNDIALMGGFEFNFLKDLNLGARYTYSINAFSKGKPYFGVFQLNLKYYVWRSNKQYFGKNRTAE